MQPHRPPRFLPSLTVCQLSVTRAHSRALCVQLCEPTLSTTPLVYIYITCPLRGSCITCLKNRLVPISKKRFSATSASLSPRSASYSRTSKWRTIMNQPGKCHRIPQTGSFSHSHDTALIARSLMAILHRRTSHTCRPSRAALASTSGVSCLSMRLLIFHRKVYGVSIMTSRSGSQDLL